MRADRFEGFCCCVEMNRDEAGQVVGGEDVVGLPVAGYKITECERTLTNFCAGAGQFVSDLFTPSVWGRNIVMLYTWSF